MSDKAEGTAREIQLTIPLIAKEIKKIVTNMENEQDAMELSAYCDHMEALETDLQRQLAERGERLEQAQIVMNAIVANCRADLVNGKDWEQQYWERMNYARKAAETWLAAQEGR